MRPLMFSLVALMVLSLTLPVSGEMTGREIMDKVDAQFQSDDEKSTINFILINKRGKERRREMEIFSKEISDTEERRFLRFLKPGDIKGTLLLTYDYEDKDDEIWLFLPALGRPRRISAGNKTDNFVGSDLTFEDMSNLTLDNFEFKLLKSEDYGGEACYLVEAIPTAEKEKKESGYAKRRSWISQKTFLPRKVEYYDKKKGKQVKVSTLEDVRDIAGTDKQRSFRWEMENLKKKTKTILEYQSIELNTGIKDSTFSQKMLK